MQCNTTCAAGHDCPYVACGVLTSALGCILSRGLKKASLVETEVQQFHRRAKMQLGDKLMRAAAQGTGKQSARGHGKVLK